MFNYEGQTVRTVLDEKDELWFVAKDVCDVLSIANVSRSLSRLDADEKGIHNMNTLGGQQQLSIVSESGLYAVIMTSRKPEAKAFKRWITHEVLPTIRKTGRYEITPVEPKLPATLEEYLDLDEDERGAAYFMTRKQKKVLETQLAIAAPKVEQFFLIA